MGTNADAIERAIAGGPPALLGILDDEVEWDYVGAFPEVVTYHGPAEVARFLEEWTSGFEGFGIEAEEVVDADDRVLVLVHQWGRGRDTGAAVENRTWQLFTFREGRVMHCRGYETEGEARAAAGLAT
ncbi:MAG: nuclear transport factor 2 family protein [Thermoleophilaceae bacterium]|nr:nuclear transport factor 2 family protein [Thermoleophilaceae bacterium]